MELLLGIALVAGATSGQGAGGAASSNVNLAVFTLNGHPGVDGGTYYYAAGTLGAGLVVEPEDPRATVFIDNPLETMHPRENFCLITVTAADGVTQVSYWVTAYVYTADTSVVAYVNGEVVNYGDSITLPTGTTSVNVSVVPNDEFATYQILQGQTALVAGDTELRILVTADDHTTQSVWVANLHIINSGVKQVVRFNDFSDSMSLASYGEGRHLGVDNGGTFRVFWAQTGHEEMPATYGAVFHVVYVEVGDEISTIIDSFAAVMSSYFDCWVEFGTDLVVRDRTIGPRAEPICTACNFGAVETAGSDPF